MRVIAVTKYVDESKMIEAFNAGIRDFAESKIQDFLRKFENLPDEVKNQVTWHFIGHLQTNKIKKVISLFDYIHSVDSLRLAEEISEQAFAGGIEQKILLQINNAEEETKFGFNTTEIKEVFEKIIGLKSLKVVGLMSMAPYTEDSELLHKLFREIKQLKDYLENKYSYPMHELSMGMSNDYKIAVEEGSTLIRLGSLIFS